MTSTDRPFVRADVLLNADVKDRQGLFQSVAQAWSARHRVRPDEVVRSLDARERLGSTGLGQGVAIPHSRSAALQFTLTAFVRTTSPIDFDAPDEMLVDCFVFLLVPLHAVDDHLQLLSRLAQKLSVSAFRDRLRAATTPEEIQLLFDGEYDSKAALANDIQHPRPS